MTQQQISVGQDIAVQHPPQRQVQRLVRNPSAFLSLFASSECRSLDHTYGTGLGYYMYIETSYPQKPGDKARLISPVYPVTAGGSCLQFFYHMWGATTGALNIYLKTPAGIEETPLWALSRDQGDYWRTARATVQAAKSFQVIDLICLLSRCNLGQTTVCLGRLRRYCRVQLYW